MSEQTPDADVVGLEDEQEDTGSELPVLKADATDAEVEAFFEHGRLRVVQEKNDFFLPHVVDFIEGRKWGNLRPEYQRRLRWDAVKKSRLIESFIMNVPVPPVFLYEKSIGSYEVMDGQQRLSAIVDFYKGSFELTGLKVWPALNGRTFTKLPPLIQRGLERAKVSAITLTSDPGSPEAGRALRSQVFERLNTGGENLNAQELRNALHGGKFNEAIVDLAGLKVFTDAWGIPDHKKHTRQDDTPDALLRENILYKRMTDVEIVLRYFAFRTSEKISGSVRAMLDNAAKDGEKLDDDTVKQLTDEYTRTISVAHQIFGESLFRLAPTQGRERGSLSRPMYDAVMVALHETEDKWPNLIENKDAAKDAVIALSKPEAETYDLMVGRGNTASVIKDRIALVKKALVSAL